MADQASRLRELAAAYRARAAEPAPRRRTRVIAVTSGKGGVGKTNLSINLAQVLIASGKDVILLDADLGLANAHVLLGSVPPYHMGHLLRGEQDIVGLIHTTPSRLKLIAGGYAVEELVDLTPAQLNRFVVALSELDGRADYLFVDTGAGVNHVVLSFVLAADEVLLVTTPEPTALADAYATIKILHRRNPQIQIRLIINQAQDFREGREAAQRLVATARSFLGLEVQILGTVPRDPCVWQAVRAGRPFVEAYPLSPASRAVRAMGKVLLVESMAPADAGEKAEAAPTGFFQRLARLLVRREQ
ncbi:MAG TPA: MinD/ParA family protein [Symbiobacteriaceae bacterium]